MKKHVFSPLRNRSYRTLFVSQLYTDLGNWLDLLAIGAIITFSWQLGLEANAGMVLAMGLPFVIIGPFASVWVDRYPCRRVLLTSAALRLLVIAGFLLVENLYALLFLIFMKSVLATLSEPARQTMLRHVVLQEEMAEASALGQMASNGMKMAGPALGGLLLAVSSPKLVFAVEAVVFLVAIAIMFKLPDRPIQDPATKSQSHIGIEIARGFQFLFHHEVMRSAVAIVGLSTFIMFLYDGFFAPLVKVLGLNTLGYGLITGSLGCGSVVGGLIAGQFTQWRKHPVLFMAAGRILSGLLLLGVGCGAFFGFAKGSTLYWMIHFGFTGAIGIAMTVPYAYLLQTVTPKALIGRVSAVGMAVQGLAILTAPSLGALLGEWLGLGAVFAIAGCLMSVVGVGGVIIQRKKDLTITVRS